MEMVETCKRRWSIYRWGSWEKLHWYGLPTLPRCTRIAKNQRWQMCFGKRGKW